MTKKKAPTKVGKQTKKSVGIIKSDQQQILTYKSKPVATTAQIAEKLEVTANRINDTFREQGKNFTEGEDFFLLKGYELKDFRL